MNSAQLARLVRRTRVRAKFGAFVIVIFVIGAVVAVMFPVFAPARQGRGRTSLSHVRQTAVVCLMYANDNDGHMPLAQSGVDGVVPYAKNDFIFRDLEIEDREEDEYGIAFYRPVSGESPDDVVEPEGVPLTFQSTLLHRNASSDLSTRPKTTEGRRLFVAFMDSHARYKPLEWPETPIVLRFKPVLNEEEGETEP